MWDEKGWGAGGWQGGWVLLKTLRELEPDSNLTCCVTLSKTLNLSGCYLPSTPQSVSKCLLSICRVPGPEDTGSHSLAHAIHSPGMSSPRLLMLEKECHFCLRTLPTWHLSAQPCQAVSLLPQPSAHPVWTPDSQR